LEKTKAKKTEPIEKLVDYLEIIEDSIKNYLRSSSVIVLGNVKSNKKKIPINVNFFDFKELINKKIIDINKEIEKKLGIGLYKKSEIESYKDIKNKKEPEEILKDNTITNIELNEIAKKSGLNSIEWYTRENFFKPLRVISRKEASLPGKGNISIYGYDAKRILNVIFKLKKLGIKLKLDQIKYYVDLLEFDNKAYEEIKKIKREDELLNEFISMRLTDKRKIELMKRYHSLYCEVLISRWWIFEEALEAWNYINLIEPYKDMDKSSTEFLEIDNILNNSGIETNVNEVKNINEAWVKASYDHPINKTITSKFKN